MPPIHRTPEIVPNSQAAAARDVSDQAPLPETTSMTVPEKLMHDFEGILHAPNPGASTEEIRKQNLKQLRLYLQEFLSQQYGIPEELLQTKSLDEIAQEMLQIGRAVQDIILQSKQGARHITSIQHLFAEPTTMNEDPDEAKPAKPKVHKSEKKRQRTRDRREAQATIHTALEELNQEQGLLGKASNQLVKLDGQAYSLHDVLGHYLGTELKAILASVTQRQHGDDIHMSDNELAQAKKSELVESFAAAVPADFFQFLLKRLGLESAIPKFIAAQNKLLAQKYVSLQDSFNNPSGETSNWNQVMKALLKELELKTKSQKQPQLASKLKTSGFSPSFISKIKSFWRDKDAAIFRASTVA